MRDWPPCPPIQRDSGRRSRPGVNPFISALTVARCPRYSLSGVWPQLRHFVHKLERRTRELGLSYTPLSADESRPALAAPRHASTAPFSCRFKCPLPSPAGNGIFTATLKRAYNYTTPLASAKVAKMGALPL